MQRLFVILSLVGLALAACSPAATPGTQAPPVDTLVPSPTQQVGEPAASDTPVTSPVVTTSASATPAEALPTDTPAPLHGAGLIAFTGADGNLALVEPDGGEVRQITQDAVDFGGGQTAPEQVITYCCTQWSSDGSLLAYRRDVGTAVASGYEYVSELWVYQADSGEARLLLEHEDGNPGFAWKPGAHVIAYARSIPTEYFMDQNSQLAAGIWALEADTGETYELVAPERGFALVAPQWSPDGRFLSFDEVFAMEGRGYFAYYDFEAQEYVSWEQAIGQYDWSPDGEYVAYDTLTYTATGEERIWRRDRQGGEARSLSPDYGDGYAFRPRFSPEGEQLAYLAAMDGPESNRVSVFVVDLRDGEARDLGLFTQVYELAWSPDGAYLVLSSGPFEAPQVVVVSVSDGDSAVLAGGRNAAWQPRVP